MSDQRIPYIPTLCDISTDEQEPLTEDAREVFLKCLMTDQRAPNQAVYEAGASNNPEIPDHPASKIILGRLAQGVRVTIPAALVTSYFAPDPGKAVMWSFTLSWMHHDKTRKYGADEVIRTDDLANAFPYGFPSEQAHERIWDIQKGRFMDPETRRTLIGEGNAVDKAWAWHERATERPELSGVDPDLRTMEMAP